MMEAIVLAGGFGTRLHHIVSDVPKPMAPVDGRPFLRYVLDDLIRKGVDRIVLAVGYKKECISHYFGNSYRGAELVYSPEDQPLLTGGAAKQALSLCREDSVFIVNGDTFFDVDFKSIFDFKKKKQASFVISACEMHNFERYGTLKFDSNMKLIGFQEKCKTKKGIINAGIYLIDRNFLSSIPESSFSLEKDILEKKVDKEKIFIFISNGYFIDIGIPEDYKRAQIELKKRHTVNKAVFFDRDGTINIDIGYLHKKENLVFINGMPEFIRKWNDWGYKVIVVTNQSGIARGIYTENDMRALHKYMNERLAEYGAHIDAFYFCPHHPNFTKPCTCRKPESGMIKNAIKEFDLNPSQCILFGDQPWDIEAACKADVFGLLVSSQKSQGGDIL